MSPKTKEIKVGVRTETHDLDVKGEAIRRLLLEGHRVKVVVQMKGREQAHPELAAIMLERMIIRGLSHGKVITPAKQEGRHMFAILAPRKDGPTKTTRM